MRKIFFMFVVLVLTNTISAQVWNTINAEATEPYTLRLLSSNDESMIVELTFNGFFTTEVETPNGDAVIVSNDEMASIVEVGQPDLPSMSVPMIIDDMAKMESHLLRGEYVDYHDVDIAPFKGHFPRTVDPDDVPYTYDEVYQLDEFFPSSQIKLDSPYILRDFRAQNLKITPFAYNPQTKVLRVFNKMIIQVTRVGDDDFNVLTRNSKNVKIDKEFKHIYEDRFINYKEMSSKYEVVEEEGDLLIICHDAFMTAMQDFVDWKLSIGRNTVMVGTSETGTANTDIKSYISYYYEDNPNLTHILLVGDVAHIPGKYLSFGYYSGYSDWWYGQISGDDYYNELIVGRFCVEDVEDVNTHVEKVIHYERDIDISDTWLTVGQGVSKRENQGGHFGEDDYVHMDNIRDDLLDYNYTNVHRDYENVPGVNSSASVISQHINEGVSLINYCNHGSPSSWGVFSYDNNDVNNLVNDNMLPFIISVACNNGQYDYNRDICFAEAWLRATNNTNGNPTGAVGGMFSYISQPWVPPMYGQDEMVDILTESYSTNIKRTMGGVSLNGNMKILDIGGSVTEYCATYNTWILFGDPTLTLRNDIPENMQVSHNNNMSPNSTLFVVNAVNADGAMATLSRNNEIMGSAVIENGTATISFNAPNTTGEATLTVFGFNKLTYVNTIDIMEGGTNVLSVNVNANPTIIAEGATSILTANAQGGDGTYSYSWSPTSSLNNANIQFPVANPSETTNYTCVVSSGTESVSASVLVIVVLPPTDLDVNVNGNDVELSWQVSEYADSYNVYRDDELIASTANTSYVDSDLNEGSYEYTVTSVYENVESISAEVHTAVITNMTVMTYVNPGVIVEGGETTLSAHVTGANGTVSYSWTPANSLHNPNSSVTAAFPTETTTYTVTATCGSQSASAEQTVQVVEIPEGLTATLEGNNAILEWNEVDLAYYYIVMRDGYVLNSYVPENTYIDDNLSEGTYCYTVKAVRDILVTPETEPVCIEIEGDGCVPPRDITASYYWYDGEFGALIDWYRIESAVELTEYRVYRSKDNVEYELVGTLANVPGMDHYQYSDMISTIGTFYYKVSAYYSKIDCESEYGLAQDSTEDYVVIDVTSVNESHDDMVNIYPNPANDKLNIKAKQINSLMIVNMMGQVILKQEANSDDLVLDINDIESGMYLLHINTESGILTKRINILK